MSKNVSKSHNITSTSVNNDSSLNEVKEMNHKPSAAHQNTDDDDDDNNFIPKDIQLVVELHQEYVNRQKKINSLQKEVDLLDSVQSLRSALRIDSPDYELALKSLKHIEQFNFDTLVLKKHRIIVETIQKVAKYVGNISGWNVCANKCDIDMYAKNALKIRKKAHGILKKFILLFAVPADHTFQEIYDMEIDIFFRRTQHLDLNTFFTSTSYEELFG